MAKTALFVGATLTAAPDASAYFSEVKVPGNMSKADTINAHRNKVREEREEHLSFPPMGFAGSMLPNDDNYENHGHRPMVGMLASVTVIDDEANTLYSQVEKGDPPRGKVARPFLSYLMDSFPGQFSCSLRYADSTPEVILFGFNLKQVLRIAAFETHKLRKEDNANFHVPVRLWHNPVGVYDVLDILLPAGDRKDLDLYSVLKYFDIDADVEALSTSAARQAEVVSQLYHAMQLGP